jgi:hypothetical protein
MSVAPREMFPNGPNLLQTTHISQIGPNNPGQSHVSPVGYQSPPGVHPPAVLSPPPGFVHPTRPQAARQSTQTVNPMAAGLTTGSPMLMNGEFFLLFEMWLSHTEPSLLPALKGITHMQTKAIPMMRKRLLFL